MSQPYDRADLDRLSRPELLGLASKLELKLPPALAKDELIDLLVRAGKVPAESLASSEKASSEPSRLSLRQLENHLWDAANILRGKDRQRRLQALHLRPAVLQAPMRRVARRVRGAIPALRRS